MDHYEKFVALCLDCALTIEDMEDKTKRKIHNRAMTELEQLSREMVKEPDKCADIVLRLLAHENENVRISAGAYCIQAQVHQRQGRAALKALARKAASPYLRLTAEQCLKYCVPFER